MHLRAAVLASLDSHGGNVRRTAAEWNLPVVTVWQWSKGRPAVPDEIRTQKRRDLADYLKELVIRASLVDPSHPDFMDICIRAGIMIDRLLRLNELLNQRPKSSVPTNQGNAFFLGQLTWEEMVQLWRMHQPATGPHSVGIVDPENWTAS